MTAPKKPAAKPAAARKPRKVYSDPALRDKLKAEVMAGTKGGPAGKWSARKAQLLAHEYEAAGGKYAGPKTETQKHLSGWTDEKWTTADGKPAARGDTTARYLPAEAWDKLTPAEKKATDAKKRAGSRAGKGVVANTAKAKAARKPAAKKAAG